nr:glutamyl-tRNA reductase [Denitrobaculum tricleocarpae]
MIGVSQRTASMTLRDRLFAEEADQSQILKELSEAGVSQALVISTCERLDILAVQDADEASSAQAPLQGIEARLRLVMARRIGEDPRVLDEEGYFHRGRAALRHVFAVTSSLDSQVIGEPQILGQVKASHRQALEQNMSGPLLEAVMQAAFGTAKRVRSETPVAQQPVSLIASALQTARDLHGDLSRCAGLLVGLGEMGELLAIEFQAAGLSELTVLHSSDRRAEIASHRFGCHTRPWQELDRALEAADVVITAAGGGRYSLEPAMIDAALRKRRKKPMFLVDASVPGDVAPAVGEMDGVYVYDLDDLESLALAGKVSRETATMAAWKILGEELLRFERKWAERAAAPSVAQLRRHFEAVRDQVLSEGKLDADAATRLLINRLLHEPSKALRENAAEVTQGPDHDALVRAASHLFGLGECADLVPGEIKKDEDAAGHPKDASGCGGESVKE